MEYFPTFDSLGYYTIVYTIAVIVTWVARCLNPVVTMLAQQKSITKWRGEKVPRRVGGWAFTVLLVLSLPELSASESASVWVSGSFEVQAFNQSGKTTATTNRFECICAIDGKYILKLSPTAVRQAESVMSFDGVDTYDVHKFLPAGGNTNGTGESANAPAAISSGNFPFAPLFGDNGRGVLWLALASSAYFQNRSNSGVMPLPWAFPRHSLMAYGYHYSARFIDGDLNLPFQMEFKRDVSLDLPEREEFERPEINVPKHQTFYETLRQELANRKAEWPDGFLAANYTAKDITNLSRHTVPTKFVCTVYHPLWRHSPRLVFSGEVQDVKLTNVTHAFRPEVTETNVPVLDARFRGRGKLNALNEIVYNLHGEWLPTNDARLQTLAEGSFRDQRRITYGSWITKRALVLGTLLAVALGLPILVCAWLRGRKDIYPGEDKS